MISHTLKPEYFMDAAFKAAQNSTCARRRVGAVIVDLSDKIVSLGWNHSSNGISCEARFFNQYIQDKYPDTAEVKMFLKALQEDPLTAHGYEKYLSSELSSVWQSFQIWTKTPEFKELHKNWQNTEIHSELSAILSAYKLGKTPSNSVLYSSRSPCIACAHAIIESKFIDKVYYTQLSLAGEGGIPILEQAGIKVEHMDPTPFEEVYYT
jgi:deoxycytidylate deaminase